MISYLLLSNEHKETSDFDLMVKNVHFFSLSPSFYDIHMTLLAFGFYTYKKGKKKIKKMMPAEPGALIKNDTNLHLLSVWREFPNRSKGLGFPKPKLEVQL